MPPGGNQAAPELPEAIRAEWSIAYEFTCHNGLYAARNRRTGAVMEPTADMGRLLAEMREDWGEAS